MSTERVYTSPLFRARDTFLGNEPPESPGEPGLMLMWACFSVSKALVFPAISHRGFFLFLFPGFRRVHYTLQSVLRLPSLQSILIFNLFPQPFPPRVKTYHDNIKPIFAFFFNFFFSSPKTSTILFGCCCCWLSVSKYVLHGVPLIPVTIKSK